MRARSGGGWVVWPEPVRDGSKTAPIGGIARQAVALANAKRDGYGHGV